MDECSRQWVEYCMNAANWTSVFILYFLNDSLDIGIQMRRGKIHCIRTESLFEGKVITSTFMI